MDGRQAGIPWGMDQWLDLGRPDLTEVTIVRLNNSKPPSGSYSRNIRPPGSSTMCSPCGT